MFKYNKLEFSEDGFRAVAEIGYVSDKLITLKYLAFNVNHVDFGYETIMALRPAGGIIGFSNSRAFLEGQEVEMWTA